MSLHEFEGFKMSNHRQQEINSLQKLTRLPKQTEFDCDSCHVLVGDNHALGETQLSVTYYRLKTKNSRGETTFKFLCPTCKNEL